jgi:hypothetical protein
MTYQRESLPQWHAPNNIKKMADIKQGRTYSDLVYQGLVFYSSMGDNRHRGPARLKYWDENQNGDLKCKLQFIYSNSDK